MRAFILDGDSVREATELADVRKAVADKKTTWIDLAEQTPEVDAFLSDALGLHPLTIEDIWSDRPSPKADEFPNYLYVCAHTVKRQNAELLTCEVDLVVSGHFVVTHDISR
jgi:magnesium transporter